MIVSDFSTFIQDQAQLDSGFDAKIKFWLNHVLKMLARRTDWKSYRKSTDVAFVATVANYNLPADFLRSDACFLVDQSGSVGMEILLVEPYTFESGYTGGQAGYPNMAMINRNTTQINFNYAAPQGADKYYRLKYFKEAPQYSTGSTDNAVTIDFEDIDILKQEVLALAFEYTDDQRQDGTMKKAKMSRQDYERNMYESEGDSKVTMDRNFFRPRTGKIRRTWRGTF